MIGCPEVNKLGLGSHTPRHMCMCLHVNTQMIYHVHTHAPLLIQSYVTYATCIHLDKDRVVKWMETRTG